MKNKVLVIAPSRNTRGGITSVLSAYESTYLWGKWNCKWIETFKDSNFFIKLLYFIRSYFLFIFLFPKYKIIHIHLSWWVSAVRKFPFFLIAFLFKKKIIIHVHSGAEKIIKNKVKFIYRIYFLKAEYTIVLAESIKDKLLDRYNFKNIQVIYNPGINVEKKSGFKKKNILFAGTLYSVKGYSDLIRAFAEVVKSHPDWTLTLAGNGEIDKARLLCNELGITENVNFTGWIFGKEKDVLFSESSIFCLPSYSEGFPMAVLDAWVYGLPVITTPVGGLTDVIVDNQNALLFQPGDIESLTNCLIKMISDQNYRNFISNNSKQMANTIFNIETIVTEVDKLYSEILNS